MAALLDQAAAAQHQDPVGGLHRGQAVGDHDGGALAQQAIKVALEGGLGGGIEEGRGLVHHQHRGVADRHPRHRQQLALTGGKVAAAFAQFVEERIRRRKAPIEVVIDEAADTSALYSTFLRDIAARIEAVEKKVGPGRVRWIHPDCGFWMLKRSIADRKMEALVLGRDLYLGR